MSSEVVRVAKSDHTCDWCKSLAEWKKLIKGVEGGMFGGGIYLRSCHQHKHLLEQVPHRKKMGR